MSPEEQALRAYVRQALAESRVYAAHVAGAALEEYARFRTAVVWMMESLGGLIPIAEVPPPGFDPVIVMEQAADLALSAAEVSVLCGMPKEFNEQMLAALKALRELRRQVLQAHSPVNCTTKGAA